MKKYIITFVLFPLLYTIPTTVAAQDWDDDDYWEEREEYLEDREEYWEEIAEEREEYLEEHNRTYRRGRYRHSRKYWARAHRYHYRHHVYFPKYRMFYDPYRDGYVYWRGRSWRFSRRLPKFLKHINLRDASIHILAHIPLTKKPEYYHRPRYRNRRDSRPSIHIGVSF